jgi:guanosine-3',5'-bis(diphosphate) 3'-pyrophosphohydrolase
MSTLEKAISIAAKAHSGQVDKGGQPYILHPLRVMMRVSRMEECITAVLHDVVEDTTVSFKDLLDEGFSSEIVDALCALTKLPGENRMEATKRAAANPIARTVKIADVQHNLELPRIPHPDADDLKRSEQYQEVLKYLQNSII